MSATCAVLGNGWTWPRGRIALSAVLFSCLVLVGAGVPAARLLPGARSELTTAPVGLQAVASAAIGAGQSEFAVRSNGGTLVASGGGLSSVFGRSGPVVHSSHGQIDLQFAGIGYGALARPAPTVPQAAGNVVSYPRSGVSEWYRSGPLGLEQGFTVRRRPSAKAAGAWLTLAVAAAGSLEPRKHGSEIIFGDSLRYSGLSAVDAAGRSLPVQLDLRGRMLLLHVNDKGARYPLTIDPFIQQGSELTAGDEVGAASFGWSVALSADGNTALIGGPWDSENNFNGATGAAWVFVRSGATWTQQGPKLTGDAGSFFANTVALSADGNTALIGGSAANNRAGAAWVFTRSGTTWTQEGPKLTASDEVGAGRLGWSVSLSADGNTALIGAPGENNLAGAAWVFTRTNSIWTQQGAALTTPDEIGAGELGYSTALSADGNTALIGGPTDNSYSGAAWVFTRSGSTWAEEGQKLTPADEDGAGQFGYSVSLAGDGTNALIGGPFDDSPAGAVWDFAQSGPSWAQQGTKLSDNDGAGVQAFGVFTALSADGDTALVGGVNPNPDSAIAFLFSRSGTTWTREASTMDGVPGSGLSTGATISGDGNTVIVGGDHDNNTTGGVWVFTRSTSPPDAPADATATPGDGEATVAFTPPYSDGGAPISSYTVSASPGGETATGTGSPITVPGLTNGTTYTFTVTATTSAGTSPASPASNPVTPFALAVGGGGGAGPGPPDLAVTLAAPSHVAAGGQATFSLAVTDPDGMPVSNIHMLVTLPAGAVVDATSSDRGTGCTAGAAGGTLDCSLGFLYPPLVAHITITLTLTTVGQATLTATVSGAQAEKNTSNNTASATVQVDPPTIITSPAPTPHPVVKKPAATVTIVGVKAVHLGKKPLLHVTVKVSKTSEVTLALVAPDGKTVARWQVHLTAGTKKLALALPVKARHAGRDKLRVKIGTSKAKTVAIEISRP